MFEDDQTNEEVIQEIPKEVAATETKSNNTFSKVRDYILMHKKLVGIAAGVVILLIVLVTFLTGATTAQDQWSTFNEKFYYNREKFTVDIQEVVRQRLFMNHRIH